MKPRINFRSIATLVTIFLLTGPGSHSGLQAQSASSVTVAESKADFTHKLSIALKETNETEYWIELLFQSGYLEEKSYLSIHTDVE